VTAESADAGAAKSRHVDEKCSVPVRRGVGIDTFIIEVKAHDPARRFVEHDGPDRVDTGPADVVTVGPNEKHWHGAAPTTAMTHIAFKSRSGKAVDWLEKVSDRAISVELQPSDGFLLEPLDEKIDEPSHARR
jgi:hypothetical protein